MQWPDWLCRSHFGKEGNSPQQDCSQAAISRGGLTGNQISGNGLKTIWSRWINIEYSSVAFHRPESTWNHSKSRRHHDVVTPHSQ